MKTQFHNLTPVARIKDALGYEWNTTSNFMNGFKHKVVDGMNLLDVQIWKNTSKWDGLVEQIIADDGTVTMRVTEEVADDYINNFLMDNIFHAFIPADIEVDREKLVKTRVGKGHTVRKMVQVVREPGYMYGQYKIVGAEQDTATGDYIFTAKPQQV